MLAKKTTIAVALSLLLVTIVILAIADPSRVLLGFLRGKAFFDWRPTSYWRERLRAAGVASTLSPELVEVFDTRASFDVLQECVNDSDPNIRLVSLNLMQRIGFVHEVEPILRSALNDPNVDVQIAAIIGLGRLGREASGAIAQLSKLTQRVEPAVQSTAHYALWQINPNMAKTIGWEEVHSENWSFTARLPTNFDQQEKTVPTPYGDAPLEAYAGSIGPIQFTIAVAEYHPNVAIEFSEEERYESTVLELAKVLGAQLTRDEPIKHGEINGRDRLIDVPGKAIMRSRVFIVADRSYQAQVVFPARHWLHPSMEEFFLDSLVIEFDEENR